MAILSIDQGTTGTRAILFNRQGRIIGDAYREITQIYPRLGWVEHNPDEILGKTLQVINEAIGATRRVAPAKIAAIGIANQRETTLLWDQRNGKPAANAIVWQCRRSAEICERLKKWKLQPVFQKKTGLVLDPYFSGTKLTWFFENVPQARALAKTGNLRFGTIDSWLLWHLTGGKTHATDYTNASRTLLLNLKTLQWDTVLQKILKVPSSILPEVRPSSGIFGETARIGKLPSGIPITGIVGDQQASLFGQGCYLPGSLKNTYGTGCFLLLNLGKKLVYSRQGLLTTVACDADGKPVYALEGAVFIGGAVVQWLRDSLKTIRTSAESERPAAQLQNNGGVYFVPAFVGLGAPYWEANARGTIVGLTRGTGREQIIRAALESICYQTRDVYETMMEETRGISVGAGPRARPIQGMPLHVDGGATANKFLMQFQADILGKPITLSPMTQSTAWGAAKLAGLAVGFWNSIEEFQKIEKAKKVFEPEMDPVTKERLYLKWKKAVDVSLGYARTNR